MSNILYAILGILLLFFIIRYKCIKKDYVDIENTLKLLLDDNTLSHYLTEVNINDTVDIKSYVEKNKHLVGILEIKDKNLNNRKIWLKFDNINDVNKLSDELEKILIYMGV